jgi:predicted choloylglycine hydrolase
MSDCVWGALDGMNAAGLAVSLNFGGRRVEGPGFGVILIVRYILETCRNAVEALAVLRRVPVHLSYNSSP